MSLLKLRAVDLILFCKLFKKILNRQIVIVLFSFFSNICEKKYYFYVFNVFEFMYVKNYDFHT